METLLLATASATTGGAASSGATDPINLLYIFILAAFVGFSVITRVPPLLHSPLMSATNAVSAITVVAALIVAGEGHSTTAGVLGCVAVACAMTNVVGGFLITDRMLKMFKKDPNAEKDTKKKEGGHR